jgi:hypothetical protein
MRGSFVYQRKRWICDCFAAIEKKSTEADYFIESPYMQEIRYHI